MSSLAVGGLSSLAVTFEAQRASDEAGATRLAPNVDRDQGSQLAARTPMKVQDSRYDSFFPRREARSRAIGCQDGRISVFRTLIGCGREQGKMLRVPKMQFRDRAPHLEERAPVPAMSSSLADYGAAGPTMSFSPLILPSP